MSYYKRQVPITVTVFLLSLCIIPRVHAGMIRIKAQTLSVNPTNITPRDIKERDYLNRPRHYPITRGDIRALRGEISFVFFSSPLMQELEPDSVFLRVIEARRDKELVKALRALCTWAPMLKYDLMPNDQRRVYNALVTLIFSIDADVFMQRLDAYPPPAPDDHKFAGIRAQVSFADEDNDAAFVRSGLLRADIIATFNAIKDTIDPMLIRRVIGSADIEQFRTLLRKNDALRSTALECIPNLVIKAILEQEKSDDVIECTELFCETFPAFATLAPNYQTDILNILFSSLIQQPGKVTEPISAEDLMEKFDATSFAISSTQQHEIQKNIMEKLSDMIRALRDEGPERDTYYDGSEKNVTRLSTRAIVQEKRTVRNKTGRRTPRQEQKQEPKQERKPKQEEKPEHIPEKGNVTFVDKFAALWGKQGRKDLEGLPVETVVVDRIGKDIYAVAAAVKEKYPALFLELSAEGQAQLFQAIWAAVSAVRLQGKTADDFIMDFKRYPQLHSNGYTAHFEKICLILCPPSPEVPSEENTTKEAQQPAPENPVQKAGRTKKRPSLPENPIDLRKVLGAQDVHLVSASNVKIFEVFRETVYERYGIDIAQKPNVDGIVKKLFFIEQYQVCGAQLLDEIIKGYADIGRFGLNDFALKYVHQLADMIGIPSELTYEQQFVTSA